MASAMNYCFFYQRAIWLHFLESTDSSDGLELAKILAPTVALTLVTLAIIAGVVYIKRIKEKNKQNS